MPSSNHVHSLLISCDKCMCIPQAKLDDPTIRKPQPKHLKRLEGRDSLSMAVPVPILKELPATDLGSLPNANSGAFYVRTIYVALLGSAMSCFDPRSLTRS
jgi:hypothetical protein